MEETMNSMMFDGPVFVKEGTFLVREIASLDDAVDFLMEWPEELQDLIHETAVRACHAAHDGRFPMSEARKAFADFAKRANILEESESVMPWMIASQPADGVPS
jgi:hypothetical protein